MEEDSLREPKSEFRTSKRTRAKKTHRVIGNNIDSGDLLEALVDDPEESAAEVLRTAVGEDVAEGGTLRSIRARLGDERLADAVVCELHRLRRIVLVLERGDDCESLSVTAVLGKPAG